MTLFLSQKPFSQSCVTVLILRFCPTRSSCCTDGVEFGFESTDLHALFHSIGVLGCVTPELIFLMKVGHIIAPLQLIPSQSLQTLQHLWTVLWLIRVLNVIGFTL